MNDSELFHGTTGPRDARCIFVGEAWGADEEREGHAFVGQSGQELTTMLAEAGIARDEVLCTNLIDRRPAPGSNDFFELFHPYAERARHVPYRGLTPKQPLLDGIDKLQQLIKRVDPEIIVGCGNFPSWALSPCYRIKDKPTVPRKGVPSRYLPSGIVSWRGSMARTDNTGKPIKFVPTIHPAGILNQWTYRARTVHDYHSRIRPILRGEQWHEPDYRFLINQSAQEVLDVLDFLIHDRVDSALTTVDIENSAGFIDIIGLGWSRTSALCVLFINPDGSPRYSLDEENSIRSRLTLLFHSNHKFIIQNATHDIPYLEAEMLWPLGRYPFLDTMVAQHTMLPGTPKSLEYLASLFCQHYIYWKDESEEWHPGMDIDSEQIYNCKDCCATFEIAEEQLAWIESVGKLEHLCEKMEELELSIDMTRSGFPINVSALNEQRISVLNQQHQYEEFLGPVMPEDMIRAASSKSTRVPWFCSPVQLMRILYDEMQFPEIKKRPAKKGEPWTRTADDEALRKLENVEPLIRPITKAIRDYRSLGTYYSNHLSMRLDPDNRVRCTFGLMAKNFRWISKANPFGRGMNLQNVPKGEDKG